VLLAESLNCKVAARLPVVVGAKTTDAVQLADAASVDPQVLLEIWKSPGLAPENAMLLMVIEVVPPFVSVTALAPPLLPTATYTQFRLVGDTDALPEAAAPVPDSATDCGLLVALSVNASVAVRVPVALGLNAMLAVQLPEAARLVPQVLLEIAKSVALAPVIATLLMVIEVVSPLDSVAVCVALVDPTVVLAKVRLVGLAETVPLGDVPRPVRATV